MKPKDKDENAKNKDWEVPMKMPGAKKGSYDSSMGAAGGTDAEMKPTKANPAKGLDSTKTI